MATNARSRFEEHLMAALDEAENGEATYHIREGLQLVQVEGSDAPTGTRRGEREGRTDDSRGASRRSLARQFAPRPPNDED